jgi:hypothetical protein
MFLQKKAGMAATLLGRAGGFPFLPEASQLAQFERYDATVPRAKEIAALRK